LVQRQVFLIPTTHGRPGDSAAGPTAPRHHKPSLFSHLIFSVKKFKKSKSVTSRTPPASRLSLQKSKPCLGLTAWRCLLGATLRRRLAPTTDGTSSHGGEALYVCCLLVIMYNVKQDTVTQCSWTTSSTGLQLMGRITAFRLPPDLMLSSQSASHILGWVLWPHTHYRPHGRPSQLGDPAGT
jgi:hypothetical protein